MQKKARPFPEKNSNTTCIEEKNMTLREKIGQTLFITVDGTEFSDELRYLIHEYKAGNAVLFKPNVDNKVQLKKLCDDIRACVLEETGYPAFIAIDQEGGGVTRLGDDCVNVPGAMALAALGDPKYTYEAARLTGKELRAFGINFNFAPVADICNNPDNPVIGIRCAGETPEQVTENVLAAFKGFEDSGIASAAKHFPGHGDTGMDSHISLPLIDKSLEQLEDTELIPFKALIDAGCPGVMTAHILYPQIEEEKIPATMSRRIMTDILRNKLGFDGIVMTDSLEMEAIARFYGADKGAVAALKAGCDMILTGKGREIIELEAKALEEAFRAGELSEEQLDLSVERILKYKAKYCRKPEGEAGLEENMTEAYELRRRTITLVCGKLCPLGNNPLFCGPEDYRLNLVSNEKGSTETLPQRMIGKFGGREISFGNAPDDSLIERAVGLVRDSSCVVINTYNGHVFTRQLELSNAVIREADRLSIPVMAVALRNVTDLDRLLPCAAKIAAWDYSTMTMAILEELFAGKFVPEGKLPVHLDCAESN